MSPTIYFENHHVADINDTQNVSMLRKRFSEKYGLPVNDFYITINGKLVDEYYKLDGCDCPVRINTKLIGGKGGFGSMLRAIGAQIEKTTNREACRDLSGRRLRDINEEQRLRKWLDGQEERDKEVADRKQKKLERMMTEPKINVKLDDPVYERERRDLPERVSAAVDAGWEASSSENGLKRKAEVIEKGKGKKKKLWIDADLSECSSSDDEGETQATTTVSTDSGNESDLTSEKSEAVKK